MKYALDASHALPNILEYRNETAHLTSALQGCNVVVNAAGIADAESAGSADLFGANSLLPLVIAHAARHAGATRLIHVSSAAVIGRRTIHERPDTNPLTPYGTSKALAERWLLASDFGFLRILRPTSVHGEDRAITRNLVALASSRFAFTASGRPRPTPQTLVETVCNSILYLAYTPDHGEKLFLTPTEHLTTVELLRLLGGTDPIKLPAWALRLMIRAMYGVSGVSPSLTAAARRADLLLFGQEQEVAYLDAHGASLVPPRDRWEALGRRIKEERGLHR